MKREAFTLVEIIITVILVSIVYAVVISGFNLRDNESKNKITLTNLKSELLSFDFEESIRLECIEDDLSCLLLKDNEKQDIKIPSFFNTIPTVYEYTQTLNKIEFSDLELEDMETYRIVFRFECKKNKRCSEMIVELEDKVYIYNDFYQTPVLLDSSSEIDEYFEKKIREVKDAF